MIPAVFAFEWMLTFDREVDLFWRRKATVSSMLFLVNRYVPLIVILIFAPWPSPPTTYAVSAEFTPVLFFADTRAYICRGMRIYVMLAARSCTESSPPRCAARYYIGAALEIFQYIPWAGEAYLMSVHDP